MSKLDHTSFLRRAVLQEIFFAFCSLPAKSIVTDTNSGASRLGKLENFSTFTMSWAQLFFLLWLNCLLSCLQGLSDCPHSVNQASLQCGEEDVLKSDAAPASGDRQLILVARAINPQHHRVRWHHSQVRKAGICSATFREMNPARCTTPCARSLCPGKQGSRGLPIMFNTKERIRRGQVFLVSVNSYTTKTCTNHQGKWGNTKGSREEQRGWKSGDLAQFHQHTGLPRAHGFTLEHHCFLFFFLTSYDMQNLSSLTRDWTYALPTESKES